MVTTVESPEDNQTRKMGRPLRQFCVHGHDTFIHGRTTGRICRICHRINTKKWNRDHPEKHRAYAKKAYDKAKERKENEDVLGNQSGD